MGKIEEAYRVFEAIQRNFPHWPSTFSMCKCNRALGRGGGPCVFCCKENIAEMAGEELAERAAKAHEEAANAWSAIYDKLKFKDNNVSQP